MTDIWILSDLHHDFEAFAWPTPPRHDLLVMAGDACDQVHKALRWVRATAPTQAPILYVPGNHDAWRCTWPLDLAEARALAADLDVQLLADGETYTFNGIRFIGATLWTDFRLRPDAEETTRTKHDNGDIHDNKWITVSERGDQPWLAADAIATHREHRGAIERGLATPHPGVTVVVTHHAPHERSLREGAWRHFSDATRASDLSELLLGPTAPDLWLHGHAHVFRDYVVGRTRIVANARGYRNENPNFAPAFTVTL
jgi:Icc-related predicted phosphoesterase